MLNCHIGSAPHAPSAAAVANLSKIACFCAMLIIGIDDEGVFTQPRFAGPVPNRYNRNGVFGSGPPSRMIENVQRRV